MKNLTLENIARVCGGTYYGPADKLQEEVMSVITDSRKAEEGCLFVPIVGERVDAHKFIPQVMEAGARTTFCLLTQSPTRHPFSHRRTRRVLF